MTGGAGFIGSHVVDRLLSEKVTVTVLDNISTGNLANLARHKYDKRLKFVKGDIRDSALVQTLAKECDAVIHDAALVSVTRSVEDPLATNDVNVNGTLNLLKASINTGVERFIYASSSSVYGESETLPKNEDMKTVPISPYGVSKLSAENYCRAFHRVYGVKTVCLRYFNVYGPRQTSGPYSGVIPIFISQFTSGQSPQIYGDGEQSRDFTNVADVVEANILALEKDGVEGEVFNIAAGHPVTLNQLAQTLKQITDSAAEPQHQAGRPGDIRHSYADIGKANRKLGYRPHVNLRDGLKEVVDWFT